MEAKNQNENQQQFAEGEENAKRRKKMKGVSRFWVLILSIDRKKTLCEQ